MFTLKAATCSGVVVVNDELTNVDAWLCSLLMLGCSHY